VGLQCDVWRAATAPDRTDPAWARALDGVPPLRLLRCRRLITVATHLDEVVAAAGGLVAALADRATTVDVLTVTDGDGTLDGSVESPRYRVTADRVARQPAAYRGVGVSMPRVHRLELPSGKVPDGEPDVVAALSELLGYDPDPTSVVCVAPWQRDGHPDHEAVGRAAELVCHSYRTRLVRYLVGTWAWAEPDDLPWDRARAVAVPASTGRRKLEAVTAWRPSVVPEPAAQEIFLV
jgi:LmbE family N-acetylglucosaminyl deacetylase